MCASIGTSYRIASHCTVSHRTTHGASQDLNSSPAPTGAQIFLSLELIQPETCSPGK